MGCRRPAALLGHIFAGDAMTSWAYVEATRFIGCCFAAGAVLGLVVALAKGERHG